MNKKVLSFLAFMFLVYNTCFAQKLYIWCPQEHNIKARIGFLDGQDIDLVIFDGRNIPKNSKVECENKNIIDDLATYLKTAYPSAKIRIVDQSDYYKKSEKRKITIKIAIAAYQAGFGVDVTVGIGSVGGSFSYGVIPKGEWNGITSYYVQIFDNRKEEEKKYPKEISEVVSKSNLWGYKTAKTCLNSSYEKANQDLLFFIENSFME
jgi:hypothetical protein